MNDSMPRADASRFERGAEQTNGHDRAARDRLDEICRGLQVDPQIAANFIDDYLRMLDERIERIDRDLAGSDPEETIVALLSLASSSSMVAARELSEVARAMRSELEAGATVTDDADDLHAAADRTRSELSAVRDYVARHH